MKALLLIPVLLLSACASVQHVQERPDGGRIQLLAAYPEFNDKAMKLAEVELNKKCPKGYDITEKGVMQKATGAAPIEVPYIDYKCKN